MTPIPTEMVSGEWLQNTLREAARLYTLAVVVGVLLAVVVRRRAHAALGERRSRVMLVLVLAHLVLLPTLGGLAAYGADRAYGAVHLVTLALTVIIAVDVALVLLFDGVLRALKLHPPRILLDIIAGGAYFVTGLVLLSRSGVHLSGLIATSAVLTAVIGFALQDTLGNLIGGLTLQLEQSMHPGDWIQFGDRVGKIRDIRWRHTAIETRNWETVIIPNSLLSKTEVVVLGRRLNEPVQWRRWVRFAVDYRFKPTDVIEACVTALTRAPIEAVAQVPPPNCVVMNMEGSFNQYAVRYWLTDLANDDGTDSRVRTRLFFALQRAGIPLAIDAHAVFLTKQTESRRQRKAQHTQGEQRDALRRVDLFARLDDAELAELAQGLRYTPFTAGETLTVQGAIGHDLYLIFSGEVSVRVVAGGTEREVAVLTEGAVFGERSLMTGASRSATAVALTDTVTYRLAKAEFERVLRRRPALANEFAEVLARREDELEEARSRLESTAPARPASDANQILAKIRDFFGL